MITTVTALKMCQLLSDLIYRVHYCKLKLIYVMKNLVLLYYTDYVIILQLSYKKINTSKTEITKT